MEKKVSIRTGGIIPQLEKPIDLGLSRHKQTCIHLFVCITITLLLSTPLAFAYEARASEQTVPAIQPQNDTPLQDNYPATTPINISEDSFAPVSTAEQVKQLFSDETVPTEYNESVSYFLRALSSFQEDIYDLYEKTEDLKGYANLSILSGVYLPEGLNATRGITIAESNGTGSIYVADHYGRNTTGNSYGSITEIDTYGNVKGYLEFSSAVYPLGIALRNDTLYVISSDKKVLKTSPDLAAQPEEAYSLPAGITSPAGMTYDPDRDAFWILDQDSGEASLIGTDGSTKGSASLGAPGIKYIGYSESSLYALDPDKVLIYNTTGALKETISISTLLADQLNITNASLLSIAVKQDANYYISDDANNVLYEIGYPGPGTVDEGVVSLAIDEVNMSYASLNASMDNLRTKLGSLSVPSEGQARYAASKSEYDASRARLDGSVKALLESSHKIKELLGTSNGSAKQGYSILLNRIAALKEDMQEVIDVIYNETSIRGAADPDYGVLSHRMLSLNRTSEPRVLANVSSAAPAPADLLETQDAQFTPYIVNKSSALTAPQLYGWVKESFSYEPYYGSLKGTEVSLQTRDATVSDLISVTRKPRNESGLTYNVNGQADYSFQYTIKQRAANDIDTASVLISLLRSRGISARYVQGTIEAPLANVAGWLGIKGTRGLESHPEGDARYVLSALRDNGIPAELSNGNVRLEHWWVAAYISGGWIDLDPSWKPATTIPMINVSYREVLEDAGYTSDDMNVSFHTLREEGNITQYSLDIFNETKSYYDADLSGYNIFPVSAGYRVVSRFAEYSELPERERHYVDVEILDGAARVLNYSAPAYEFASGVVSIRFNLTAQSASIYSKMSEPVPFLLDYSPALYVDETRVAAGSSSKTEGKAYVLRLSIRTPRDNRTIDSTLVSGSGTAVAFDVSGVSEHYFDQRLSELNESISSTSDTDARKKALSLNMIALTYFHIIDGSYEDTAARNLLSYWKPAPSVAIASEGTTAIFGIPLASSASVQLDAAEDLTAAAPLAAQAFPEAAWGYYNMLSSYNNAFAENIVLSTLETGTGNVKTVSAFLLVELAANQMIAIRSMTEDTKSRLKEVLLPSEMTRDIEKALQQGKAVSVISQPVYASEQAGYGLILADDTMGMSYVLVSQNRYTHGVLTSIADILQSIKGLIEKIPALKFIKDVLGNIMSFIDFLRNSLMAFKRMGKLPGFAEPVLKQLRIFRIFCERKFSFIKKTFDGLGVLGKIFDITDLIKYIAYCMVDLGSAICVIAWGIFKLSEAVTNLILTALTAVTGPLSLFAKEAIKYIIGQAVEAVLAAACNPYFTSTGERRAYKGFYGKKDGKQEWEEDREYYGGDLDNCYKEVTFGADQFNIVNRGMFPMLKVKYQVQSSYDKTTTVHATREIPFLPGASSGYVDWLVGSEHVWINNKSVPKADGKEDVKVQIKETRTFEYSAEDSGDCKIDYKVLGLFDNPLNANAKIPKKDSYKGTKAVIEYDKGACCRAVVSEEEYKRCLDSTSIDSSLADGTKTDAFTVKDDVYVTIKYDTQSSLGGNIYAVKSKDLTLGSTLTDKSPDGKNFIFIPTGRGNITLKIWPASGNAEDADILGDYEIILDRNYNAVYDQNDSRDLDGFSLIKRMNDPDMAIDSQGNIHIVAIERSVDKGDFLMYRKISPEEASHNYTIDLEHPDLNEWSRKLPTSGFSILRESRLGQLRSPKIAVDSKGIAHIITMYQVQSESYYWALYNTVNPYGENESRLVMLDSDYWGWSFDMMNPTIAIDPTDDLPVVAANLEVQFPEPWYIINIYLPMYMDTFAYWYGLGTSIAVTGGLAGAVVGSDLAFCGMGSCNFDPNVFLITHYADSIVVAKKDGGGNRGWSFKTVDRNERNFMRMANTNYLEEFSNPDIEIDKNGIINVAYLKREIPLYETMQNPTVVLAKGDFASGTFTKEVVSEDVEPMLYQAPSIDLDSNNNAHIVFEGRTDQKIWYRDTSAGDVSEIGETDKMFAKPKTAVDSGDNVYAVWLQQTTGKGDDVMYRMRNSTSGYDEWSEITRLTRSEEYESEPKLNYPLIATNKQLKEDWANKAYVAWIDMVDGKNRIVYQRTMPHETFLIVLDGVGNRSLADHLGEMPNLAELLSDDVTHLQTDAVPTFPATTYSALASMITGLQPKDHKVIGDNWQDHQLFPTAGPYAPTAYDDADEVNAYLESENVKTVFDYTADKGYTSAAIASIYNKGIPDEEPNKKTPIDVTWESGTVHNYDEAISYIWTTDARDNNPDNDPADLISLYILKHDHGLSGGVNDIDYAAIDEALGQIIDTTKSKYMYQDSLFVITADHSMRDVTKDDRHSLDYPDDWASNGNISATDLFLNSKVAYYYAGDDYENDILPAARYFYNMSWDNPGTDLYTAVESIYVKKDDTYYEYIYQIDQDGAVEDILVETGDQRLQELGTDKTPGIILFASTTTYDCANCTDCNDKIAMSIPGDTIRLTADILDKAGSCIEVTKSNLTIDCQGHYITGDGNGSDTGINIQGRYNTSILNCAVEYFGYGIKITSSQNTSAESNTVCYNTVSDYNLTDSPGNYGEANRCNNPGGWHDEGTDGCSYTCLAGTTTTTSSTTSSTTNTTSSSSSSSSSSTTTTTSSSTSSSPSTTTTTTSSSSSTTTTTSSSTSSSSSTTTTTTSSSSSSSSTSTTYPGTTTTTLPGTTTTTIPGPTTTTTTTTSTTSTSTTLPTGPFYFQEERESTYAIDDDTVPFIISGPAYAFFSPPAVSDVPTASIMDVAVTASYFVGGDDLVNSMASLAGRNIFMPELVVTSYSPVNIHLYDSAGRHTGYNIEGIKETSIPGSTYSTDDATGIQKIAVYSAPGSYKLVVNAYDTGVFHVDIDSRVKGKEYYTRYPVLNIINHSIAMIPEIGLSAAMRFDYDANGVFEKDYSPTAGIRLVEGTDNATAYIDASSDENITINAQKSVGTIIRAKASSDISGGILSLRRIKNNSYDSTGFYTLGEYVDITQVSGLAGKLTDINITLLYPDYRLGNISENSLGLYRWDAGSSTWKKTGNRPETLSNRFTNISSTGRYIFAGTDQAPMIHEIAVQPKKTGAPGSSISIKADISDDSVVSSVNATLLATTKAMPYNSGTKQYEASLTAPASDGVYYITVSASDDTGNVRKAATTLTVDTNRPNITITSPADSENITHNDIKVKYRITERTASEAYNLDGGMDNPIIRSGGFDINAPHGKHTLNIKATDLSGNTATASVSFEIPEHNIEVSEIDAPAYTRINEETPIRAKIRNSGNSTETVSVELLENGSVYGSRTISLERDRTENVSFDWKGAGGQYELVMRTHAVDGETYLEDNTIGTYMLATNKQVALLIDDTANTTAKNAYAQAINAAGYDYVSLKTKNTLYDGSYLKKFRTIVWFTGPETSTLGYDEMKNLKAYLDAGGYLLLSGEKIGADIGGTRFYKNYMRSTYIGTSSAELVEGVIGDPIGKGFLFSINGTGENVRPADSIAYQALTYSGQDAALVRSDDKINKVAYYSFPLESIGESGAMNRLVNRTFAWFAVDTTPPKILSSTPANGSGLPINTIETLINITTDENAECRIDTKDVYYADMKRFDQTGGKQHQVRVGDLENSADYTYHLKCRDASENTRSATLNFFVWNRTFLPPEYGISNINANEGQTIRINVSATDPENDPLTYKLEDVLKINYPKPIAGKFASSGGVFSYDAGYGDAGSYDLKVTVSDGYVQVTKELILTIMNVNRAPSLSFIGPKIVVLNASQNQYYYYKVDGSDPDGDAVTYAANTTLFDINPYTGEISYTPKNADVGNYSINISASDGEYSAWEEISFRVKNKNDAPLLDFVSPQYAAVGIPYEIRVNASDPDNDPLAYYAATPLFNITQEGIITFTPENAQTGTYYIDVSVSDGQLSASKILNLIIEDTNQAPVIKSYTTKVQTYPFRKFMINVTACDPDSDPGCSP